MKTCSVSNCIRPFSAKGLCVVHYNQARWKANPGLRAAYAKKHMEVLKSRYGRSRKTSQKPRAYRNASLKRFYGIDLARYNELFSAQEGRCAICRTTEPGHGKSKHLCVDHDHITGIVRALLCQHCNAALGHVSDSTFRLERCIDYLQIHAPVGCWEDLPWQSLT